MRATKLAAVVSLMAGAVLAGPGPASAATAELARVSPGTAVYDAAPLAFSPAGDVTAAATFVDVVIPPLPSPGSTSGCEAADFAGFPAGHIAVIQRGTCTFRLKALNAQAAGATAVVIFNEGQPGRTGVIGGTLGGPGVAIPVVFTSFAAAEELFFLGGVTLRVAVESELGLCAAPPAPGTPVAGRNVIMAQPGAVTVGTSGPDVIYGTPGPDRISGLGGDDLVFGFDGDDQISGGDGDDTLCGGPGNDRLLGDAGDDEISGDAGDDALAGGNGNDLLVDAEGTNRLSGDAGTDMCSPFGTPASTATGCETIQP